MAKENGHLALIEKSFKFQLVLFLAALSIISTCASCVSKIRPSYRMSARSREKGYRNKAMDQEVAHIFAQLQYDPNRATEIIENHLAKADREWPFYALLGDVLIESKRYDYAEPVLKLAYFKLIKRIPSAEIHDPNGLLPIETGLDFQANHDPRRLLAQVYLAKLQALNCKGKEAEAERERLFKEAIFFNPRNYCLWKTYSMYLWNRNRKDESMQALANLRSNLYCLDRGTNVRITGVNTPWSAADQYNFRVGLKLKG